MKWLLFCVLAAFAVSSALLKSVHEFASGAEQSDDITMLLFKYLG